MLRSYIRQFGVFGLLDFFDLSGFHLPIPLALAVVATLGYLVGRRNKVVEQGVVARSRRELRRAQAVAKELEKISWVVRRHLTKHQSSLCKFKHRVNQLSGDHHDSGWKDLCREAEEMLKPTLQLSAQIAAAYDELRQQTNHLMTFTEIRTDPLTGISNRRALDDTLDSQFALMVRYDSSFSMVIFDIDHFKRVNDEHGHLGGDQILRDVAKVLDDSVRETDSLVRYGGEEFIIIMPQTDIEGAAVFSDRIRRRVADQTPVTISGGVTAALDGDTPESIMARADAALYDAKSSGRDCVFQHDGECICQVNVDADVAKV